MQSDLLLLLYLPCHNELQPAELQLINPSFFKVFLDRCLVAATRQVTNRNINQVKTYVHSAIHSAIHDTLRARLDSAISNV